MYTPTDASITAQLHHALQLHEALQLQKSLYDKFPTIFEYRERLLRDSLRIGGVDLVVDEPPACLTRPAAPWNF
jgi:hypothetical protein